MKEQRKETPEQDNKEQDEVIQNMESVQKPNKKSSTLVKVIVFVVMVAASIAVGQTNFLQTCHDFLYGTLSGTLDSNVTKEVVDKTTAVEGKHVRIRNNEIYFIREINEILDQDSSKGAAIEELKEIKTLAYYGENAGYAVSKENLNDEEEALKKELKKSNEYKYEAMISQHSSEKAFWKAMKEILTDRILSTRVKTEKEKSLRKTKEESEIPACLQEYIKERIEEEQFKEK